MGLFFVRQNSFVQESRRHMVTMSVTTFHFCCEMATVTKYCAINCLIPELEMQQGMV